MIGQRRYGNPYKGTRLHNIWRGMRQRCGHFKGGHQRDLERYRDRGIQVCEQWRSDFIAFESWALTNGYEDDLVIDRKDVDGDYSPENCRWVNVTESNRNKSNTLTPQQKRRITVLRTAGLGHRRIGKRLGIDPITAYNYYSGRTFA